MDNKKRLYLLSRKDLKSYEGIGQYISAVVVAESPEQAVSIHPMGIGTQTVLTRETLNQMDEGDQYNYAWAALEDIEVTEIGIVEDNNEHVGYDFIGTVHVNYYNE